MTEYNFTDEDGNCIEPPQDHIREKVISLRTTLEDIISEETHEWTCDYKHDVTENVLFNIWLSEIKAIASMDYERAKSETESYIQTIRNKMEIWKDLKHE